MEYTRQFKRTRAGKNNVELGPLGTVTLVVPDGPWGFVARDADGNVIAQSDNLPANIVQVLVDQSLSPVTDSYAGDTALADARASFTTKVTNLASGRYNVRATSASVDPVTDETRRLLAVQITAQNADTWAGVVGEDLPEFRNKKGELNFRDLVDDPRVAEYVDAVFAKQKPAVREAIEAKARENVAAAEAAREASRLAREAKKAASGTTLKLG